jgi:hypothetical protein
MFKFETADTEVEILDCVNNDTTPCNYIVEDDSANYDFDEKY